MGIHDIQAARHQREIDEATALEFRKEALEMEMETALRGMEFFTLECGKRFHPETQTFDGTTVAGEMLEFDGDAICEAYRLMDTEPLMAVAKLRALRDRAIQQIIGRAKIHEAAVFQGEQQ